MFIKTFKLKKPNILAAAVLVTAVAALALIILTAWKFVSPAVYEMKTEAQRQDFLSEMGWEVSDEYDECKAVVIPEKFNEVYAGYNKLQKQQGFDLSKFKGKTAEVYTYSVKNYKGCEKDGHVKANLIIYEGQLIGGDVCSTELDGFMQGLKNGAM